MLRLPFTWTHLIVGLIFAGGGGFVALVTTFSHQTIRDIQGLERIKQANKKLLHDVNHDELTGLYKRNCFIDAVNMALRNKQRYQIPAVLWYIDLNRFKKINDTYGHLAGDQVLVAISNLLRQHFRKGDAIARLGGDEFAVLMNETHLAEAKESQQRLLERLVLLEIPFDGQRLKISMAIGMTEIESNHQDITEIIAIADKYCYQSKRNILETD